LADHLYGELPPAEAAAVQAHVETCAGCRDEFAALAGVRALLDAEKPPVVAVDLPRLYREVADRQRLRLRSWRRLALAGSALAATLLLLLGMKLEVRFGGQQVVVRWGNPPADRPAVIMPPPAPDQTNVDERLRLLQELTHALAADVDARDHRQRDEQIRLRAQLDSLRRQADQRWVETAKDVTALYTLHTRFPRPEKGATP
jgi:hypothetical protein